MVALLLSIILNFVLVLICRYNFGRTVLEPTAGSQWAEPLGDLAGKDQGGNTVPDRDLVLALTPRTVEALAERFERVRAILGPKGKKPKFDAVVTVTTTKLTEVQGHVEKALDQVTKRWKLDEVVQHRQAVGTLLSRPHAQVGEPRCALDGDWHEGRWRHC